MNSFIGWVGGKKILRKAVCERFPAEFSKYVEVFGGAGWVLFNSEKHANFEVYNDINSELVNLFRCVKYHPDARDQEMGLILNSRELFNCFRSQSIEGLTDIQRAARYLYLIKASYGNKVSTYGSKPRRINNVSDFKDVQKRLEKVIVENKNYVALIKQYDSTDTLFYCDPPYYQAESLYDTGSFIFDEEQHIELENVLSGLKGKFILSYNDCDFIKDLYKGFVIEEVERQSNLASRYGTDKVYKELIIKNY